MLIYSALTLAAVKSSLRADTHLYAGAVGTNPGDALAFTVAALFDTHSGYRLPMVLRTNGFNAGYYRGDTLTFTALSASDLGTGQLPGRALFGSRLAVELASVTGPEGGAVQFWEGDGENPGDHVTFELRVGETQGTNSFIISENDGSPGSDPYGHIHGREFTTSKAGLYTVGFRLLDISTNGPAGGPLHSPSEIFEMYFQAGPVIEAVKPSAGGFRVSYRSAPGVTNMLEFTDSLEAPAWRPATGGLRGNSTLQTLVDTNSAPEIRFYRLSLRNIPP